MKTEDESKKAAMWIRHSVKIEPVDEVDETTTHVASENVPETLDASSSSKPKTTTSKTKNRGSMPAFLVKHRVAIVAVTLLFGISWVLCSVFLSNIRIGSTKVQAYSNKQKLAFTLGEQIDAYKLSIRYPDGKTKQYPLKEVGISVDEKATVNAIQSQKNKIQNRLLWWKTIDTEFVFMNDDAKLKAFISSEVDVSIQPYKDATLKIDNGKITLIDAENGIRYRISNPEKVLKEAVTSLQNEPIVVEKLIENPKLTTELLKPYKETIEKTLNQTIVFQIGDKKVSPDASQIASWLDVTPDIDNKKMKITVNSGKVEEYINKIARSSIRPAKNELILDKPDGSSQIISAGIRGVDIKNKSDVSVAIANKLLDGNGITEEFTVEFQPYKTVRSAFYPKWIEADITNKRLYAHEYGETVKTILISAGAPATPTVTGEYTIGRKLVSQDMRGQNVDGSNYFQPRVPWVLYFYGGYAIHGNYWRPLSWFGNINSSHGCIGMTTDEAQWVYNWAPSGTPVIIYK